MIRPATHSDLPIMLDLGEIMHAESPRFSRLRFSRSRLEETLNSILLAPLGFLWVAESEVGVFGGLAAIAAPHYASEDLVSSDLALFIEPAHRGGLAAVRLINRYRWWARDNGVVIRQLGVTTGLKTEETAKLLEQLGMTRCGVILEDN